MKLHHEKTDVLVIGGGVAGLMAAYWTSASYSITLLSTGRGASPFITGYNAVVSEGDSIDIFAEDTYNSGRKQGDPELIRALCEGSAETIEFLKGLGFEFNYDGELIRARQPAGASFPRVIGNGNISGKIIGDLLRDELKKRDNCSLLDSVRVLRLMQKNGRICGALGVDSGTGRIVCFDASAVILAVGGFCRIFEFSTNTSDIGGDGIAMAYESGLPLIDLEFVQFEPSAAVWPPTIRGDGMITTLNYEGAVFKNALGERFMFNYDPNGERTNKDVMGRAIFREVSEGRGTEHGGVWYDCTAVPEKRIHEAYEMFYQRYIRQGIDIAKEAVELYPAAHTSLGGVAINSDCSTALPGLFACGEITGGLYGANRIGGTAGTETQVFGKIAGLSVSKYLDEKSNVEFSSDIEWQELASSMSGCENAAPLTSEEMQAMRREMQKALSDSMNVIRNGADMAKAERLISAMLEKTTHSGKQDGISGFLEKNRLQNDLRTAQLLILCALDRTENCGNYWRTDDEESGIKYRIFVQKTRNGLPAVKKEHLPWLG